MKPIFLVLCSLVVVNACKQQPTEPDTGQRVTGVFWEKTSLDSLNVHILATSGTNIFAGTTTGVFLSTNSGASWAVINTGLKDTLVFSLAVDGSTLFAGTRQAVFHSTNNGASWVEAGLFPGPVFSLVVFGPTVVAYAAGMRDGCCGLVFSTTDRGKSWKQVATPDEEEGVLTFGVNGPDLLAGSKGIFRSTNSAESWMRISSDTIFAVSLISHGLHLFAGGQGLFGSTDNGTSWILTNAAFANTFIRALSSDGTNLFAATHGGVFLSTDDGTNWIEASNGLPDAGSVNTLGVSGTNVFAGTYAGVFKGTVK